MTLVVTGATGHLGRLVVDHLLARGTAAEDIVATGRDAAKLEQVAATTGVRTAVADFGDPASLDAAFAGAEAVLLVSGSEVGRRVAQHTAVIEATARAGARLVYTSAPQATTSALVLAPEHKATEEAIAASGVPATILRNNWYVENYAQAIADLAGSGRTLSSAADGRVAAAERTEYAEAAAVALTDPALVGSVLELGGDTAWTQDELADAVSAATGRPAAIEHLDPAAHAAALQSFGLDEGTAGFVVALDGNIRDGLLADSDGSLARLLGRPTTPLAESVARLVPAA